MGYFKDLLQETQRRRAEKKMQDDVAEIQRRALQAGREIMDGCIDFANNLLNIRDLNNEVKFITVPRGWCKKEFERSKQMSKPKFKIGDKVKILDGSKIKDYTYGWVDVMSQSVGEEDTIIQIYSLFGDKYGYHLKNRGCMWDERGLELVKPETIVIYRKGDETIALDKATGKTAKATCSKDDEYDFYTGAKIALERLTEPQRKFKVGDRVIGNKNASKLYGFTKEDWKGVVKEVKEYPFIFVRGILDGCPFNVDENFFDLYTEDEKKDDEIKVGDTVIGLPSANFYTVTKEGYIGTVEEVLGDSFKIKGADGFSPWVEKCHFRVLSPEEVKKYAIKVGDKVRIENATLLRPGCVSWAERNIKHPRLLARFDPKGNIGFSDLERVFYVLAIGEGKALISTNTGHEPCYVIDLKGLAKA